MDTRARMSFIKHIIHTHRAHRTAVLVPKTFNSNEVDRDITKVDE